MEREKNIDEIFHEMAINQWEDFKKLVNIDSTNFVICIKKKEGKSIRQISSITKVPKTTVSRICNTCP